MKDQTFLLSLSNRQNQQYLLQQLSFSSSLLHKELGHSSNLKSVKQEGPHPQVLQLTIKQLQEQIKSYVIVNQKMRVQLTQKQAQIQLLTNQKQQTLTINEELIAKNKQLRTCLQDNKIIISNMQTQITKKNKQILQIQDLRIINNVLKKRIAEAKGKCQINQQQLREDQNQTSNSQLDKKTKFNQRNKKTQQKNLNEASLPQDLQGQQDYFKQSKKLKLKHLIFSEQHKEVQELQQKNQKQKLIFEIKTVRHQKKELQNKIQKQRQQNLQLSAKLPKMQEKVNVLLGKFQNFRQQNSNLKMRVKQLQEENQILKQVLRSQFKSKDFYNLSQKLLKSLKICQEIVSVAKKQYNNQLVSFAQLYANKSNKIKYQISNLRQIQNRNPKLKSVSKLKKFKNGQKSKRNIKQSYSLQLTKKSHNKQSLLLEKTFKNYINNDENNMSKAQSEYSSRTNMSFNELQHLLSEKIKTQKNEIEKKKQKTILKDIKNTNFPSNENFKKDFLKRLKKI